MTEPAQPLENWTRQYYEPGGGDAFLFYVVFGAVDASAPMSRARYRSDGIPAGLEVMAYGPGSHPEVVSSFRKGYLWDQLCSTRPELATVIAAQDSCIILRGTFPDPKDLNYFRDTIGLVTHLLDHGGVAVYDPQMFAWWTPIEWHERLFVPAAAVPQRHVVVLISEEADGTEWLHTRGLRKFGRPDLSIPNAPIAKREAFTDLCNRFIELQAFGGTIAEGQEIRMRSLPSGLTCRHAGDLDDPEFNNVHVRIAHDAG